MFISFAQTDRHTHTFLDIIPFCFFFFFFFFFFLFFFLFFQVGVNDDGKIMAIDFLVYGNGGHSSEQSPYVSKLMLEMKVRNKQCHLSMFLFPTDNFREL